MEFNGTQENNTLIGVGSEDGEILIVDITDINNPVHYNPSDKVVNKGIITAYNKQ